MRAQLDPQKIPDAAAEAAVAELTKLQAKTPGVLTGGTKP